MCGIVAGFKTNATRPVVVEMLRKIQHRGPDSSSLWSDDAGNYLGHQRLSIVSPENGNQPFETSDFVWMVNGEIYNHPGWTTSDSEVVGTLYGSLGVRTAETLDGKFAFVLFDKTRKQVYAARDHLGICPLYIAHGYDGSVWFASEMKCFSKNPIIKKCEIFPPGHYYFDGALVPWYTHDWVPTRPADLEKIQSTLVRAVKKRLIVDVPFGVLLSGGLDSSLIASIVVRNSKQPVHSFSIGIEGAPDLVYARIVADYLGTVHHEFHFTTQEAIDALPEVIWHLETFEQVRASVPMYLMARKIRALGFKMVLSGEGADELFGGYLYFQKAPSRAEFHNECVRKTTRLHQWDVLRANKTTMAFGVETRVPFLDKEMVDMALSMAPADKIAGIEKAVLRRAFEGWLPEKVLWRQKEQFSDGVGYTWVDSLKDYADREISDGKFDRRFSRFEVNPPNTKEYYLLRSIFEEFYPEKWCLETVPFGKSIACSTPEAAEWDPTWKIMDISGRALAHHMDPDLKITNS